MKYFFNLFFWIHIFFCFFLAEAERQRICDGQPHRLTGHIYTVEQSSFVAALKKSVPCKSNIASLY